MFKKELAFNGFIFIAFWFFLLAILVFLFGRWHATTLGGIEAIVINDVEKKVLIRMSRHHRYQAIGRINHEKVLFIIDTGADSVAVPMSIAKKVGLAFLGDIIIKTASGQVKGNMTRIRDISLGPIRLTNIRAVIIPTQSNYVLLGMSALKKLTLNQKDNLLTLIQPIDN